MSLSGLKGNSTDMPRRRYFAPASAKQLAFVREYTLCLNATEAARRAGYGTPHEAAKRLMKQWPVKSRIEHHRRSVAQKYRVTMDRIVGELAKIGFANVADFVRINAQGEAVIDLSAASRAELAALQSIETTENVGDVSTTRTTKLKLWDKGTALVALGKHLGGFKDRTEVTGTVNLVALIEESLKPRVEAPLIEGTATKLENAIEQSQDKQ